MDTEHLPAESPKRGPEPPPPGVHAMAALRWVLLALAIAAATFSWFLFARAQLHDHGGAAQGPRYHCPMHPQIVSDQPGECPICHMSLEPIAPARTKPSGSTSAASVAPSATSSGAPASSGTAAFACPMHPHVTSAHPGRCPICHMDLEPIKNAPASSASASASAGRAASEAHRAPTAGATAGAMPMMPATSGSAEPPPPPGSTPPGTTPVHLTLDRIQSIGVRTALAADRTADHGLRVTAVVEAPEQGVSEVHVRAPGFVESIAVAQTGVSVKRGQTLLTLYSPELYQAQAELLASKQWQEASGGGPSTPSAARRKLLLLGMSEKDIDRVVAKGEPIRAIPIYAPAAGFVAKKSVNLGSYVTPETLLYEIQDLSRVYVVADVFQSDVGVLARGGVGRFYPTRRRGVVVEAKIDLLYPTLNAEARTTRVRMQLKNDKQPLSPGEYGTVEFATPPRRTVVVPRDALVDTGKYTYVFVVEGEGQFSPRVVVVGEDLGDGVAILDGLHAGDRVVSGATFLIDSESRLEASIESAAASTPVSPGGGDTAAGPSCDGEFDRTTFPDKWVECEKCRQVHHGMGSMEADCKNGIAKPWK